MTTYDSTTTLAEIRAAGPCGIRPTDDVGWAKLLRTLGEPHGNPNLERQVTVLQILDSNGLDDATWCLRVPALERLSRYFGAWCAEQVLHLFEAEFPNDPRPRQAIAVARDDSTTPEQRDAARDAAKAAAGNARAARDAAWAAWAAWAAAGAAPWVAAGDAAGDAAWAAHERQLRKMLAGEA
jgi:hypothetical protein